MSPKTEQYRKENNLCYRCGDANALGRKMCKKHLNESANKERVKREHRKSKNLCARCGKNKPDEEKTICAICLDKNREKFNARKMDLYYERRSSKLCVQCGDSVEHYDVYCDKCKEYMQQKDKDRYSRLKENETCVSCGKNELVKNEVLCKDCKIIFKKQGKTYRNKQKYMVINYYGGKCNCCEETKIIFLSIDHIKNDGNKHRKKIKEPLYRWIIRNNYPEDMFQVLCYNCNQAKRINGGICPHQQKGNK